MRAQQEAEFRDVASDAVLQAWLTPAVTGAVTAGGSALMGAAIAGQAITQLFIIGATAGGAVSAVLAGAIESLLPGGSNFASEPLKVLSDPKWQKMHVDCDEKIKIE